MRDFKQIKAWQRAHALAIALHKLSSGFTRAGHSRLRAQLTTAAESIEQNIVSGSGTKSSRDFARYLDMSIKSANETEGHLLSSRDLSLVSPDEWQKYSTETIEIRKMIYTYRQRVLQDE